MKPTVTMRWLFAAVLGALLLPAGSAFAQEKPSLGDDNFIFFVDGANVLIPNVGPTTAADPADPMSDNKVAQCDYGDFFACTFGWEQEVGADMSAYIGDTYGASDTMYIRLRSGPENVGKPVSITFFDKTNHPGLTRAELEGGADGDLEFRIVWDIPEEWHDGAWHEAAVPLPPATIAALDSAKVGKNADGTDLGIDVDTLATLWSYTGGWNNGGSYGFGNPGGFDPASEDPLFEEFEWDAMHMVGVFFDNNAGGESVYIDYLYISGPEIAVSELSAPPAAMGAIDVAADGEVNVVSWTHNPDFGGYKVYFSSEPITDVESPAVVEVANVPFDAEAFSVSHRYEIPHPSLGTQPLYYAVTSVSLFGTENTDVSSSTGNVTNGDLAQQAYILELTDDEADALFDDISNGIVSDESFPEDMPRFIIDESHRQLSEGGTLPDNSDINGWLIMGYSSFNELYVYAEITDPDIQFGVDGTATGGDSWQYDSIEIGWGNYDVRDADGSIVTGSPHSDMQRGDFADYQFRFGAFQDGTTGDVVNTYTHVGWSIEDDAQGSATVVEKTDTGWRSLTVLPLNAIQSADDGDATLQPPASDEIRYIPMDIALNDADGSNREHQINWGLKPNHTNQWWNTPNQWPTVAMAGRAVTRTDREDAPEVVGATFSLSASYPNPFHSNTTMDYSLPQADQVHMAVYDILGRQVAVLVDGFKPAGSHKVRLSATGLASGAYLVRLQAGDHVAVQRVTLVK